MSTVSTFMELLAGERSLGASMTTVTPRPLGGQALGRIALLGLLRHGRGLGLGGGLGLVHLLRGLLRFRAVGLVLGLRLGLGLSDRLGELGRLPVVTLGVGVVREHGHVQEREHQQHRQQDSKL